VVLFILLCGQPPFYDEDNFELYEKIKNCDYNLDKPEWANVSEEAKDFIRKLLVAEPCDRMGPDDIKTHKWITGDYQPN
jgi:serine/threonine protein kinase